MRNIFWGQGENLLDLDVLARSKPLVALSAGELVDTVVARNEGSGTGAVEDNDRGHLVPARSAEHPSSLVPDALRARGCHSQLVSGSSVVKLAGQR